MPSSQLVSPVVSAASGPAEQQEHQQADDAVTPERDDDHRHQTPEPLRHFEAS